MGWRTRDESVFCSATSHIQCHVHVYSCGISVYVRSHISIFLNNLILLMAMLW